MTHWIWQDESSPGVRPARSWVNRVITLFLLIGISGILYLLTKIIQ